MAILAPWAIFEVLSRAKKSNLGESKYYASRTTQNDARNIEKSDWIDFGERLGRNENYSKMSILVPGAIFEVLFRAKKSKLGQLKHYTSSTTPNDARNIEKSDWIDFGERLGRNEDCTKLASFYPFFKKDGTSKLQMLFKLLSFDKA